MILTFYLFISKVWKDLLTATKTVEQQGPQRYQSPQEDQLEEWDKCLETFLLAYCYHTSNEYWYYSSFNV